MKIPEINMKKLRGHLESELNNAIEDLIVGEWDEVTAPVGILSLPDGRVLEVQVRIVADMEDHITDTVKTRKTRA